MKSSVKAWLRKAEGDAVTAWREYRARKRPNWDSACFHAQQTVEKCLKAALESWDERISKVHDLTVLLAACLKKRPEWELMRDDLELLSQYAVTFRYPGAEATREQARLAVQAMERCRKIIAVVL